MTVTAHAPRCRGFARSDAIAMLALLAVSAALVLAASRQMRSEAVTASGLSQLRWIANSTSSYAADSNDQFWSYSWKARESYSFRGDMVTPSTDSSAAVYQALDILDRRAGRSDIPVPAGWIPHARFNHLPLIDYLGRPQPDFQFVAPGDRHRRDWARDPEGFDRGALLPFQPAPSESNKRWPYSTSYEASVGFWDLGTWQGQRVYQASTHTHWTIPSEASLGGATLARVAFPSQKVMVFDSEQRDLGAGGLFFADRSARVALLMADGSAGVRTTGDSNLGWHPVAGFPTGSMRFRYVPSAWEPPVGPDGDILFGHYRWTRGGIVGRDFGGPEIDTGP